MTDEDNKPFRRLLVTFPADATEGAKRIQIDLSDEEPKITSHMCDIQPPTTLHQKSDSESCSQKNVEKNVGDAPLVDQIKNGTIHYNNTSHKNFRQPFKPESIEQVERPKIASSTSLCVTLPSKASKISERREKGIVHSSSAKEKLLRFLGKTKTQSESKIAVKKCRASNPKKLKLIDKKNVKLEAFLQLFKNKASSSTSTTQFSSKASAFSNQNALHPTVDTAGCENSLTLKKCQKEELGKVHDNSCLQRNLFVSSNSSKSLEKLPSACNSPIFRSRQSASLCASLQSLAASSFTDQLSEDFEKSMEVMESPLFCAKKFDEENKENVPYQVGETLQQHQSLGSPNLLKKPPLPPRSQRARRTAEKLHKESKESCSQRRDTCLDDVKNGESKVKATVSRSSSNKWSCSSIGANHDHNNYERMQHDIFHPNNQEDEQLDVRGDERFSKLGYEVDRSRESVASSKGNVNEMETSVRSSMIIDPNGRKGKLPITISRVLDSESEAADANLCVAYCQVPSIDSYRTNDFHRALAAHNFSSTSKASNDDGKRCTSHEYYEGSSSTRAEPYRVYEEKNDKSFDEEWNRAVYEITEAFNNGPHISSDNDSLFNQTREVDEEDHWKKLNGHNITSENCSNVFNRDQDVTCEDIVDQVIETLNSISEGNLQTVSMLNLRSTHMSTLTPGKNGSSENSSDKARSMEFLLDGSDKNDHLRPPENRLMKNEENRQPSEHELRIQRSLQKLNVPEWYKKHSTPVSSPSGSKLSLRKGFGSGTGLAGGWSGLSSSKTPSLSSLQSSGGRYAGHTQFSRFRNTGGSASAGGRPRENIMSPSSTASASPSPYYDRSSFTYGMPYAFARFATTRMGGGASPASLSPSPSPVGGVGSSTSTPVSCGPSLRYGMHHRQPYMGWRSQEQMNSKALYRTPSERMAADLLAQKSKVKISTIPNKKEKLEVSISSSTNPETASDLSLNNSEDSSSNKINRVRSHIKAVSNAIVDYVNETKPLDDGTNGASPRRGFVWLESSFVGTKPLESPKTPEAPIILPTSNRGKGYNFELEQPRKTRNAFNFDEKDDSSYLNREKVIEPPTEEISRRGNYMSRNEQMEQRSNTSSVSSPTLEDILDSLLALRRPNKKFKSRNQGHVGEKGTVKTEKEERYEKSEEPLKQGTSYNTSTSFVSRAGQDTSSDWQDRMNKPIEDSALYCGNDDILLASNNYANQVSEETQEASESRTYKEFLASSGEPVQPSQDISTFRKPWPDDGSSAVDVEENAFGTPTEILPTSGSHNQNEATPPTPARNRRVSFDLDFSDKEEKSSSRSKNKEESLGSIQCRNPKCGKTATGLEARREFKTCHNCNAYYCSRECRRAHWDKHKKVCMQSRVGALCKQIISHIKEDSFVVTQLSQTAKRGYLAKGRGCVKLFFSSPDRAERFLTGGFPELPEPCYIHYGDILPEEMNGQMFTDLSDQCRLYNPESRFIVFVSVCVVNEVPTTGAVKWERELISRIAKIRLLLPRSYDESVPMSRHVGSSGKVVTVPPHDLLSHPSSGTNKAIVTSADRHHEGDTSACLTEESDTLILRSVPLPSHQLRSHEYKKLREVSFTNIQRHLLQRGVNLKKSYPDIYKKLCNYVEHDEPFLPATIYPFSSQTGRHFMCVIMPECCDTSQISGINPNSINIETIDLQDI